MPIVNGKDVRFLALPYSRNEIAIGKELMIDYESGILYVKSKDGKRNIQLGRYTLIDKSSLRFNEITEGVSEDYNTLKKIENKLTPFINWKDEITKDSDVDNIINILNDLFSLYDEYGGNLKLKDLLDLKVDKEEGKGLSTNDFTNDLKQKLIGIEEKANNYKHPPNQVCNYKIKIKKINNQTGKVILNKETLGLGRVPNTVKIYKHPSNKVCNEKVVTSINGKTKDIFLSKKDVGLGNVADLPPAGDYNVYTLLSKSSMTNLISLIPGIYDMYLTGDSSSFDKIVDSVKSNLSRLENTNTNHGYEFLQDIINKMRARWS